MSAAVYIGYLNKDKAKALNIIFEYCIRNNIEPINILIDYTPKLTELVKLKNSIDSGLVSEVLTYSLLDLASEEWGRRNLLQEGTTTYKNVKIQCLENRKHSGLTLKGNKIFSKTVNQFNKAINTLKNTDQLKLDTIYGYDNLGSEDEPQLVINKTEAKIVQKIFSLRLVSGYTIDQITAYCCLNKYKTKQGKSFTTEIVNQIFEDMWAYVGKTVLPSNDIVENLYPPILYQTLYIEYYKNQWASKEWLNYKRINKKKVLLDFRV